MGWLTRKDYMKCDGSSSEARLFSNTHRNGSLTSLDSNSSTNSNSSNSSETVNKAFQDLKNKSKQLAQTIFFNKKSQEHEKVNQAFRTDYGTFDF